MRKWKADVISAWELSLSTTYLKLNNLQVCFLIFQNHFMQNLASFGLYYHILENKKAGMHLAKDVVIIDDIKMPNMGHIARGKPQM